MKQSYLFILLTLSFGCSKPLFYEGNQEDLTGTWELAEITLDEPRGSNRRYVEVEDCDDKETIVIDVSGNAEWFGFTQECEKEDSSIYKFLAVGENVNFNIETEVYYDWLFLSGKFLNKNEIEIYKSLSYGEESNSIFYYYFTKN